MSDADLRELERRFRETGSVEDEAAWLRARLQAGELEQSRLELASWVHPASALALERELADVFSSWSTGIQVDLACVADAPQRSAIALARSFARETRRGVSHYDLDQLQGALEILERLAVCPCRRHEREFKAMCVRHHEDIRMVTKPTPVLWSLLCRGVNWEALLALGSVSDFQVALKADLVPWLLGYGDPVRERVEARQKEAGGEA